MYQYSEIDFSRAKKNEVVIQLHELFRDMSLLYLLDLRTTYVSGEWTFLPVFKAECVGLHAVVVDTRSRLVKTQLLAQPVIRACFLHKAHIVEVCVKQKLWILCPLFCNHLKDSVLTKHQTSSTFSTTKQSSLVVHVLNVTSGVEREVTNIIINQRQMNKDHSIGGYIMCSVLYVNNVM